MTISAPSEAVPGTSLSSTPVVATAFAAAWDRVIGVAVSRQPTDHTIPDRNGPLRQHRLRQLRDVVAFRFFPSRQVCRTVSRLSTDARANLFTRKRDNDVENAASSSS